MMSSRAAALAAAVMLAAVLGQGPSKALAADADASAIALGTDPSDVFVGGSAQSAPELRSSLAGRWNAARGSFDWLERVDAAPGAADAFTAIVPAGAFLYGVGSANGQLAVAKMDADTGRLRRACGATGVRVSSLGPAVLPGRAVAVGGHIVVVGRTLARPMRGFIADVDGGTCAVVRSALVAAADPGVDVGFTAVDADASGNPVVSGFSGGKAAVFRFDRSLIPRGTQTFDLGRSPGAVFSDVKIGPDRGVAVARAGSRLLAACFTLPGLTPDARCGMGGLRALRYPGPGVPAGGATLARLPTGSWLVAGAHAGTAGFASGRLRPALGAFQPATLGADRHVFALAGTQGFDPFRSEPAAFGAVAASSTGIAAVGDSGLPGSRSPFLFSARLDGTKPEFTPLPGMTTAPAARVEPAPPAPPQAPAPVGGVAPVAREVAPLARARFGRLAHRPAADGTFGVLTLSCRHECTARGRYSAHVRRHRRARLGSTTARLAANWHLRMRLTLTRAGLRLLARAGRLEVTVRFVVSDRAGAAQLLRRTMTLHARRAS
jgi:hypothetical protein